MTESERRAAYARALELATGAFRTDVLAAACALHLVDTLTGEDRCLGDLAAALGTPAHGLELLLNAGCAVGLFGKCADQYLLPEPLRPLLGSGQPAPLPAALRGAAGASDRAQAIVTAVREGTGRPGSVPASLDGIASALGAFAPDIAPLIDLTGCARVLDLTNTAGAFAVALAQRHHGLHATVVESPSATATARQSATRCGLGDRITVVGADQPAGRIGRGYGAIVLGRTLSTCDEAMAARILEAGRRRLADGGAIHIADTMLDRGATDPPFAALLALECWINGSPGRVRRRSEHAALLTNAGFGQVREVRLIPPSVASLVWGTM